MNRSATIAEITLEAVSGSWSLVLPPTCRRTARRRASKPVAAEPSVPTTRPTTVTKTTATVTTTTMATTTVATARVQILSLSVHAHELLLLPRSVRNVARRRRIAPQAQKVDDAFLNGAVHDREPRIAPVAVLSRHGVAPHLLRTRVRRELDDHCRATCYTSKPKKMR